MNCTCPEFKKDVVLNARVKKKKEVKVNLFVSNHRLQHYL
jgi:hypothetical protein